MVPLQNILFLDIETVSQYSSFDGLPREWKELWSKKAEGLLRNKENLTIEGVYERAGIYAEFGKIICISCGILQMNGSQKKLLLKSFFGEDEKEILSSFCDMLSKWAAEGNKYLCAHNGKEFDFPYKFGDFKSYTSLNLLAHALSIPTPKDDIDGSMVGDIYWNSQDIPRIVNYCQKDVR
jgi:hypothetical protein